MGTLKGIVKGLGFRGLGFKGLGFRGLRFHGTHDASCCALPPLPGMWVTYRVRPGIAWASQVDLVSPPVAVVAMKHAFCSVLLPSLFLGCHWLRHFRDLFEGVLILSSLS